MIDINKYVKEDHIIPDLAGVSKEEAIKRLVRVIFEGKDVPVQPIDQEHAIEAVLKREELQSTGVGDGIAFPHARISGWKEMSMAVGISREGINFGSIDDKPVNLIFLFMSPEEEPYIILQAMATISRVVTESKIADKILRGNISKEWIIEEFNRIKIKPTEQILASDIARPVVNFAKLNNPIEEATRTMHLNRLDILPVLNEKDEYCGEISCLDIFEYGMPDFFKQLNTVSFVKHIDPFEKYFKIKGDLKVSDFYKEGGSSIKDNATLLEIIFDMTVKKRSKLFVVKENGKLAGVIDRFCIIDKVLFF
ncbi:MAG: PTS sugar transporter subunit IIA [Candidatus Omnitrophota bacterium]